MACYEPINVADLMRARRAKRMLEPLPRNDVGVVIRDQGPGTWRGVLVGGAMGADPLQGSA